MRTGIIRRLEALEKEHFAREQQELAALSRARMYIWRTVLAYYLGGLELDEKDVSDAHARALKYSREEFFEVILENEETLADFVGRHWDAYHRLFKMAGLNFDKTPPNVLFDAFVGMVDNLPDKWLNSLRSDLREWCSGAEIAEGSNVPRRLCADNFIEYPKRRAAG